MAIQTAKPISAGDYNSAAQPLSLQAKLKVGEVNDPLEVEADAVADRVMRMPDVPTVQRKCADCAAEDEKLKRKPLSAQLMPFIQAKSASFGGETVPDAVDSGIAGSRGGGSPLPDTTRSFMESRFGSDFSAVKIHTGDDAAQMNRELHARAFTVGNDIFFNSGAYDPSSDSGKRLLAHELTHTLQQQPSVKGLYRKVDEASVEAEFNKWADANKKQKSRTHKDFPWNAWDFIRPQIVNDVMEPLSKPKDKAGLEKWNDNFAKAEIIGNWLANLKASTQDNDLKSEAAGKIYFISESMAKAGLISKAMAQAANIDNSQKALVYGTILKNPSAASASEVETIFTFQTTGQADPAAVDFIKTLCRSDGNDLQKLDAAKTQAMFKVMIDKYAAHDKVLEAIAATLIFNTSVRMKIADAMMNSTLGSPELLFKVLSHAYFKDPEYAGAILINTPNNDTDKDTDLHWANDMPFAFKYKQQYYVKYLMDLCAKQKNAVTAPADYQITTLKAWLDKNTETIAKSAAVEFSGNNNAIFDIYRNLADIFFYHVDHDKDVIPDNEGKLAKLGTGGKPINSRIEADCDVFATYAMRLFNSAGFQPIGYLGLYPTGTFVGRAAHAAALIRKGGSYFVINNKNLFESGVSEAKPDEKKEDAIKAMKSKAIDDAYGDPKPTNWEIYYADAEANGKLPADFLSKPAKYLRTNL